MSRYGYLTVGLLAASLALNGYLILGTKSSDLPPDSQHQNLSNKNTRESPYPGLGSGGRERIESNRPRFPDASISGDHAESILAIASNYEGDERIERIASIAKAWALEDGLSASRWFEGADGSLRRTEIAEGIVSGWMETDPNAAAGWVDTLKAEETLITHLTEFLAMIWTESDPEKAFLWTERASESRDVGATLQLVTEEWFETDSLGLLAKIRSMPLSEPSIEAYRVYASMMAEESPEEAWKMRDQIESPLVRNEFSNYVIDVWADTSPSSAASAIANEGDQYTRAEMSKVLAGKWVYTDETTALRWVESIPQGIVRQAAIQSIVENTVDFDPLIALNWSQQITDEPVRAEQTLAAFQLLLESNPIKARQWISSTKIDPLISSKLEKMLSE